MRVAFTPFPQGSGFIARPCVRVRLDADPTQTATPALVDTGSVRTIVPSSFIETLGIELGHEVERVSLRFGGVQEDAVPVHHLDLVIASPDPAVWPDIAIDSVAVACCRNTELPFFILGASALTRLVLLVREYDQVLHIRPMEEFMAARHFSDNRF